MEPKIQWHPAFCSAAELEFRADRKSLEFYPEKNLSRRPLEMDLLIIRKNRDISLQFDTQIVVTAQRRNSQ